MIRLLIIADDFTGALDTGVQLAENGASTRVITNPMADLGAYASDAEVLVVDAETRHLSGSQAYNTVAHIVKQAQQLGIPYIYKKTDSALRGNIGSELSAILEASGEKQLPFMPAFPQIGRKTIAGNHFINGVPVADSVFGDDPFEPVCHSNIVEMIKAQSSIPVTCSPALNGDLPVPETDGIVVFDAENVEDLAVTGRRLFMSGRLHIMAGCAGFGAILPGLLGITANKPAVHPALSPRLMVVCGSVNPITQTQLDAAENNGFARFRLTPRQKLDKEYWKTDKGKAEFNVISSELEKNPLFILDSNDAEGNQLTADYAAQRGIDINGIRVRIAETIGYIMKGLFTNEALGTLLITGGDTLLQCMNCMGVYEVEPVCEIDAGVVLSRFTYNGCTRYVLSKSGGFGGKNLLIDMIEKITQTNKEA
jgi:uncharacterized protein YgbK (DUF1537 family)